MEKALITGITAQDGSRFVDLLVKRLKEIDPYKIILFGSYAHGIELGSLFSKEISEEGKVLYEKSYKIPKIFRVNSQDQTDLSRLPRGLCELFNGACPWKRSYSTGWSVKACPMKCLLFHRGYSIWTKQIRMSNVRT